MCGTDIVCLQTRACLTAQPCVLQSPTLKHHSPAKPGTKSAPKTTKRANQFSISTGIGGNIHPQPGSGPLHTHPPNNPCRATPSHTLLDPPGPVLYPGQRAVRTHSVCMCVWTPLGTLHVQQLRHAVPVACTHVCCRSTTGNKACSCSKQRTDGRTGRTLSQGMDRMPPAGASAAATHAHSHHVLSCVVGRKRPTMSLCCTGNTRGKTLTCRE